MVFVCWFGLFTLGAMPSPPAHALGKTQYKALELEIAGARNVQKILDQESAQGWEYVGMILNTLVFKK